MPKMKTRKSLSKRVKITAKKKILRRHQFAVGHLKGHQKEMIFFKSESKKIKKMLGI